MQICTGNFLMQRGTTWCQHSGKFWKALLSKEKKKRFCQKKRMSKISWSPGTWVINSDRNVGISLAKNVRFFLLKRDIWQTRWHWGVTKGLNCEWSVNGGLSDFLDEALKILLTKKWEYFTNQMFVFNRIFGGCEACRMQSGFMKTLNKGQNMPMIFFFAGKVNKFTKREYLWLVGEWRDCWRLSDLQRALGE